ncbi:hypothetical protein VQ042_17910 [Aurantimonas sp. A2-1-M11]|uniref:hypothetical protein n=1 Tax=Aurantimonas sp. A2-1-M11 TaxID=3113712 RepID=UPI002F931647
MTTSIRYQVEPRDVSPEKAARRLGLTLPEFQDVLPRLLSRGFPPPDLDTGNFDLDEIDAWRARRHRPLPGAPVANQSAGRAMARIAAMGNGEG